MELTDEEIKSELARVLVGLYDPTAVELVPTCVDVATASDLRRAPGRVIKGLQQKGWPVIVTVRNRPMAVLVPIDLLTTWLNERMDEEDEESKLDEDGEDELLATIASADNDHD